jgi:hypothetical protein
MPPAEWLAAAAQVGPGSPLTAFLAAGSVVAGHSTAQLA